ncbi:MAG: signal peptidase II [Candidatus Latescibacteria bacterium]|nr:signal peptidase II [Candidatus Latescibacterota bacterium]
MTFLWIIPLAVAIDQTSKFIVRGSMALYQSEPVLGNFFRLTYIHNPGAAFGLNMGSPLLHTAFSFLALGILIYLYRSLAANEQLLRLALCLVLGGAVGNIIDRLYLGEVVGDLRWPIFNFADSFVTVGVLLLALGYSRREKTDSSPESEEEIVRE